MQSSLCWCSLTVKKIREIMLLMSFQGYKMSSTYLRPPAFPPCCVHAFWFPARRPSLVITWRPTVVLSVLSCVIMHLFTVMHFQWIPLPHSCIYGAIQALYGEISRSHEPRMLCHLHTYSIRCSYTFVLGCFSAIAAHGAGDTVITDFTRRTLYPPRQQKTCSPMWLLPQG